jgi:hypothetical protein
MRLNTIAEENSATLNDFNATNTLHWRPSRKFSGEDYFDVLVFRFYDNASPVLLPEDLQKTLEEQRIDLFLNSYH